MAVQLSAEILAVVKLSACGGSTPPAVGSPPVTEKIAGLLSCAVLGSTVFVFGVRLAALCFSTTTAVRSIFVKQVVTDFSLSLTVLLCAIFGLRFPLVTAFSLARPTIWSVFPMGIDADGGVALRLTIKLLAEFRLRFPLIAAFPCAFTAVRGIIPTLISTAEIWALTLAV